MTAPEHRQTPRERGFTLVELMVVVAIIAVLSAVVAVYVKPGRYSRSASGFADAVATELDNARWRATGSSHWHMVSVEASNLRVSRADANGMSGLPLTGGTCTDPYNGGAGDPDVPDLNLVEPATCWGFVRSLMVPEGVDIVKVEAEAQLEPNVTTTADGDGINSAILMAPDGSVRDSGWTIYIADDARSELYRVVLFRASGTATVLEGW